MNSISHLEKVDLRHLQTTEKFDYIHDLIDKANSQFFTVEFFKKDGSNREMVIQQSAAKFHLVENPTEAGKKAVETRKANHPNLKAVWEVSKGFRSIDLNTVHRVTSNGKTYFFNINE